MDHVRMIEHRAGSTLTEQGERTGLARISAGRAGVQVARTWCRRVVAVAGAFVASVAIVAAQPSSPAASAAGTRPTGKDILILSGVQFGLPANEATVTAIVGRLRERGVSLNDVYYERLDLTRLVTPDQQRKLAEIVKAQQDADRTGAVIVVGQPAMRFIAGVGADSVAPGVPLVTVLVSQPDVPWTGAPRPTLAIPDRVDAEGTLRAALTAFPDTQRLVVVSGREEIQRPYLAAVRKALSALPRKLEVEFTSDLAYDRMLERIATLPPATVVLYVPYFEDVTGRKLVPAEAAAAVARSARAPVFVMFEPHLVKGVAGGSVFELSAIGRAAADQAVDIVRGTKRLEIGITAVPVSPVQVFDWTEIERWRGDTAAIPQAAVVRNRPQTLWGQYRREVIVAIAVIAVLMALVTALAAANRRQMLLTSRLQSSERSLASLNAELEAKVDARTAEVTRAHTLLAEGERLAGLGVWEFDPLSQRTVWSEGARRIYGIDPAQTSPDIVRVLRDRIHPDDAALLDDVFEQAMAKQEPFELEHRIVWPDGTVRVVGSRALPNPDSSGRLVKYVGIAVDITERKRAELALAEQAEALRAAKNAAEAASRAKSTFLANMSHEIRTPMNAIIGLNHLLARDATDALQRDRLAKVDDAANHLLQIINDILDLSKIEAGKLVLEHREFALDEVLERAVGMIRSRAAEKGLELVLDSDHLPDRLVGDSTRLTQILVNLLSNAVKFTRRGWVRLRGAKVDDDGSHLMVRFEVQDTGPGLSQGQQQRLFRPFEQGDNSVTRREGGTGLGLALTRHFAELMGGEAGVSSQEGEGSTFWFTARLEHAARTERAGARPGALRGLRALLVDDLREAREAIETYLRALDVAVDVETGVEAGLRRIDLEVRQGRAYDFLLVDWQMGEIDGVEMIRRARTALGTAMPPSMLITAYDDPEMWRQVRDERISGVLLKPITVSSLSDALVNLVERSGAPAAARVTGTAEAKVRQLHAGRRILLVEDNPINQEVALELLRSVGLVTEPAIDGAQAVTLATAIRYDLVLMDMQMPIMDGLEATRQIRASRGGELPIIAMTANAFGEDQMACLAAGMNDHLGKPVDPERLYAMLLRWLPAPPDEATPEASPARAVVPEVRASGSRRPLEERLAEIPGFSLAQGLTGVGSRVDVLVRILRRFIGTYRLGVPGLLQAAGRGDAAAVITACHSVRGACAAVGAIDAEKLAAELERSAGSLDPEALTASGRALHAELIAIVERLAAELGA